MDTVRPRHTWVPYIAGLAGAALLLKAVLIIAGNPGSDADGILAVLYLSGIALGLAAAIGAGLRRRGIGARIGVAVGLSALLVVWIIGLGDLLKPVIGLISDAQRVKDEVPIGIGGIVLLILAYLGYSHDQKTAVQSADQERTTPSRAK
jgi:hypothetical protein